MNDRTRVPGNLTHTIDERRGCLGEIREEDVGALSLAKGQPVSAWHSMIDPTLHHRPSGQETGGQQIGRPVRCAGSVAT